MSCTPAQIQRDGGGERPAEASPDAGEELILHLEPDQFVAATAEPVAPAPLGPRAKALLWGLRIFVVLVSIMVIYTFVDRLH
ncbi:MAG TPA: hypothetical protein VGO14_10990 [Solirubrobacteraceae bacterium]|jgi:hypothetical protein|nr:hypothetical protein [Solirubrobacteraceae bacterium]